MPNNTGENETDCDSMEGDEKEAAGQIRTVDLRFTKASQSDRKCNSANSYDASPKLVVPMVVLKTDETDCDTMRQTKYSQTGIPSELVSAWPLLDEHERQMIIAFARSALERNSTSEDD